MKKGYKNGLGMKVLAVTIATAALMTSFTSAESAVDNKKVACDMHHARKVERNFMKDRLQKVLDDMVKDNTINNKQKDAITEKLYKNVFIGPMQALIVDGVITETQIGPIFKAMVEGKKAGKTRDAILQELVNKKVITDKQKDEILKRTPTIPSNREFKREMTH